MSDRRMSLTLKVTVHHRESDADSVLKALQRAGFSLEEELEDDRTTPTVKLVSFEVTDSRDE